MAATANIRATITGKGAHGAMPNQGNDPIVIASQIVTALQSIVARNVDPVESGVITIGHIQGGDTWNVIPQNVTLRGTARWFKPEVGDLLEAKFTALVTGIAAAFGATAEAVFDRGYPATVNEVESTRLPSGGAGGCRRGAGAGNGAADHGRRGFLLHAERQGRQLHHARRRARPGRPAGAPSAL